MGIKEKILEKFNQNIKQLIEDLVLYQPEKVILFGSFAKDDFHEGSDIDIVVIKNTTKRFLDRIEELLGLYKGDMGLEVLVYTPQEFEKMKEEKNPFIVEVLTEGKVIYESK